MALSRLAALWRTVLLLFCSADDFRQLTAHEPHGLAFVRFGRQSPYVEGTPFITSSDPHGGAPTGYGYGRCRPAYWSLRLFARLTI